MNWSPGIPMRWSLLVLTLSFHLIEIYFYQSDPVYQAFSFLKNLYQHFFINCSLRYTLVWHLKSGLKLWIHSSTYVPFTSSGCQRRHEFCAFSVPLALRESCFGSLDPRWPWVVNQSQPKSKGLIWGNFGPSLILRMSFLGHSWPGALDSGIGGHCAGNGCLLLQVGYVSWLKTFLRNSEKIKRLCLGRSVLLLGGECWALIIETFYLWQLLRQLTASTAEDNQFPWGSNWICWSYQYTK